MMTADQTLSPALLGQFGDMIEVGILTLDTGLVIRGWNGWLEAASGRPAAELLGRPVLDVFPELRGGHAEPALRTALAGGTVVFSHRLHRYILPLPPSAGYEEFERMQQSARVVPMLRDDGTVASVVVLIQDVTERVAREEALRTAMRRAEAASQAKSEFLASMSHELRTPLAAVVGYVDVLSHEMSGPLTPTQANHLRRIRACATHLMSIIEEILTFSRVEAGKESLAPDDCDAAELARQAVAVLEPGAAGKGLDLVVELPAQPIPIRSDPTKLRQVLINLLGNAVKFTDAGSIRLELETCPSAVRFLVTDTGPGILPEDLDRIFEPFTQVDQSRTRTKGGTGLGLPVSRRLAHLLGGRLDVQSERGVGSTFTLTIPFHIDASATEGSTPASL